MELLKLSDVDRKIITLRDQQVILDSDVAVLYGVATREINQAIKNNPAKFPAGYIIRVDKEEWANLMSKSLISSWGGSRKLPNAFTEKGLYMLATILKGERATQTTLAIVETFARIRALSRQVAELVKDHQNEQKQKSIMQQGGAILSDLIGNDLQTLDTETSFELNLFATVKIKHTVKRGKKDKSPGKE